MPQAPFTSAGKSNINSSSSPCGCGGPDHAPGTCGCTHVPVFERPQYFCGQLLSDADLTLQQTYFREKSRLYHRTMDGFGVVCGLRMSCDPRCRGHVTIADGYAIDACGNDLVVSNSQSFDVIGELRKKKWLVGVPGAQVEPRGEPGENCVDTQCFYIGICYSEEPVDFATPYITECDAAPGPCQPSRIREGVRFEIYDRMPVRPNPLNSIGQRIEHCFRMFREGQFARSLAQHAPRILEVLERGEKKDSDRKIEQKDVRALFKELQAQFLHELHTNPDRYNCDLESEVFGLRVPVLDSRETGPTPIEAFTRLFELIEKHVFSCVLAQLAFSCPEPAECACVLIGSVEVSNGHLTRVINYPRWYLWCFANFFEVLLYTIANDAACGKVEETTAGQPGDEGAKEAPKRAKGGCCPAYEVDVRQFLNLFSVDPRAFEKAARTAVDAIQASYRALVEGFNFTRAGGIAPGVLRNRDRATAEQITSMLGLKLARSTGPQTGRRDIFSAFAENTIYFRPDTLVYDADDATDDARRTVTQVSGVIGAPAFAVGQYTYSMVEDIMERLTQTEERLRHCEAQLGSRKPEPPTPNNPPHNPAPPSPPPPPPPAPPRGGVR